jgi:hypothetical protein
MRRVGLPSTVFGLDVRAYKTRSPFGTKDEVDLLPLM